VFVFCSDAGFVVAVAAAVSGWDGSEPPAPIRYFWKVDCYDRATEFGSPDPADPAVTTRVLTILRADEY
jgi:hypothetical protein